LLAILRTAEPVHAHVSRLHIEDPDLGHTEPAIDIELVQERARDDDLERDVGRSAHAPNEVALVRLQTALRGLLPEGRVPRARQRVVGLEQPELEEAREERLRQLV